MSINKEDLIEYTDGNHYAVMIGAKPFVLRICNADRKIVKQFFFDATGKEEAKIEELYHFVNSHFDFDKLEETEEYYSDSVPNGGCPCWMD